MTSRSSDRRTWIDYLGEEDLAFVKRFILCSGSLKELALAYGISYPTVRLRVDRVIAKIQVAEDQQISSPFEKLLRVQFAEGKLDSDTFKRLLAAHREEIPDRPGRSEEDHEA
jgi:hypothetical protein